MKVAQSCATLCDSMDYTVHRILQARILEWVAFPFSRVSTQPRNWTQVSYIAGRFFTSWATRKPFYFEVLFNKICSVNVFLWDGFSLPKVLYWSQNTLFFLFPCSTFPSMKITESYMKNSNPNQPSLFFNVNKKQRERYPIKCLINSKQSHLLCLKKSQLKHHYFPCCHCLNLTIIPFLKYKSCLLSFLLWMRENKHS